MNSCGAGCVLFIWLIFLWPIIVSITLLNIFAPKILKRWTYFFISALLGYLFLILLNYSMNYLNSQPLLMVLVVVLFPQVAISYFLARKFS